MNTETQAGLSVRWKTVALACVFLFALAFSESLAWRYRDLPQLGQMHDDTLYLTAARSLASGSGFRIASLPGQPFQTKYPPLYPLLLTPIEALPEWAGLYLWLMLPCFVCCSWLLSRRFGVPPDASLILAIFIALSPYINFFSVTPMTELALGAMSIAAALLVDRRPAAAGLISGLAFLVRTAALPLLFALPLWLILKRRPRSAAVFAACMLPFVAGWMWWVSAHRAAASDLTALYYTDYLGYYLANFSFRELPNMVYLNVDAMLLGIGRLVLFDVNNSGIAKLLVQILGVAALAGIVRHIRERGWNPYILYAVSSAPMLLLWNFKPNERFLAGFAPLFLLGFYTEFHHVLKMVRINLLAPRRGDRVASVVLASIIAIVLVVGCWRYVYGAAIYFPATMESARRSREDRRQMFAEIVHRTPADARLATGYDGLLYLETGRQGCRMFPPTSWFYQADVRRIRAYFDGIGGFAREHGLNYILLSPDDFQPYLSAEEYREIAGALMRDPSWELVSHRNSSFLFRDRLQPVPYHGDL